MLLGWQKELTPDEVPILNERAFANCTGMGALATPIGFSSSEVGGTLELLFAGDSASSTESVRVLQD